ncbi:MAG: RlmE family RNA methyltransferase [archaeon]
MRQKDHFTKKALKEGYRARSSYKLKQINSKYNLIRPGDSVLDLGCWPGGWLIVAKELAKKGRVVGVDLEKINPIDGVEFIQGDITSVAIQKKISDKFDVVLSDMAPKTSGIKSLDVERSIELSDTALGIAKRVLKRDGSFLCKVFQGGDFEGFLKRVRKNFGFCKCVKPEASRKESKEIYIIATHFKGL